MSTDTNKAKRRSDRNDGYRIKTGLDPLHIVMPYVMGKRTENEAVLGETFDMTEVEKYIAAKNADNPEFKYTWFHFITAAVAKTLLLRPKMNWFIEGHRYYEHKDISVSFIVKRHFAENSEEASAKFVLDPNGGSPLEQVHTYVNKFVHKVRVEDKRDDMSKLMNAFGKIPRPVFKLVVSVLKWLVYHGWYPTSMSCDDPCFSSVFITNLGSIKMNADYHHLSNWGNNSFFVVVNEKKMIPLFKEDGTFEMRSTIKLGLTIDERIADGYYFARTIELVRHMFAHPELLDEPASTPIVL